MSIISTIIDQYKLFWVICVIALPRICIVEESLALLRLSLSLKTQCWLFWFFAPQYFYLINRNVHTFILFLDTIAYVYINLFSIMNIKGINYVLFTPSCGTVVLFIFGGPSTCITPLTFWFLGLAFGTLMRIWFSNLAPILLFIKTVVNKINIVTYNNSYPFDTSIWFVFTV